LINALTLIKRRSLEVITLSPLLNESEPKRLGKRLSYGFFIQYSEPKLGII
jgi:hypothetical protein